MNQAGPVDSPQALPGPCTIITLPTHTPIVLISIFARQRAGIACEPGLTVAEMRYLNSYVSHRILCLDIFGLMGSDAYFRCTLSRQTTSATPKLNGTIFEGNTELWDQV